MDGYVIIDIDARDPAAHIILQTQRRRERIQVDASTFHFNQNYNKLGIDLSLNRTVYDSYL